MNSNTSTKLRKYLTAEEVAARYKGKVSLKTLANWRTTGGGPKFSRIGGRILYPECEVEKWEAKNTVASTSEYSAK